MARGRRSWKTPNPTSVRPMAGSWTAQASPRWCSPTSACTCPTSPDAQYAYGTPSYGKAGDLVFFDEAGYGISHVGIATGYGTVIHASTYYGAVVETPIEY